MCIAGSYTAAYDDFGIIYADLNSLSSPDKSIPREIENWAIVAKNDLSHYVSKGRWDLPETKFLNPLREMIQFKKTLCKIYRVNYINVL